MQKCLKIVFYTMALFVFASSSPAYTQSIFGSYGIGELRYFMHARAAGMGGAGIALRDPLKQNHMNPALWADINTTSLSGGLRYEGLQFNRDSGSSTAQVAGISSFDINIKTTDNFAFGGGLHPYSDTDYKIRSFGDGYSWELEGSGGISMGYLGASYKVRKNISIGVNYVLLFGQETEHWEIDFDDVNLSNTVDTFSRNKWGSGVTLGMKVDVGEKYTFAGMYNLGIDLKSTNRYAYYNAVTKAESGGDASIPASFGIGAVSTVTSQLQLATDIYRWQMSDLTMDWQGDQRFKNSTRYSVGLEFFPQATYTSGLLKKMLYRCGYYYWDLYAYDIDNSTVSEQFVSIGFTIPIGQNNARFDLALEAGMRNSGSDAIGSEKIFRLHLDLTGGERWFLR